MSLQFISDDTGKTTAVVIQIQEWEGILQTHADLKKLVDKPTKEKKKKPSDFKDIFSSKEGHEFQKYLTKTRKEWDRNSY